MNGFTAIPELKASTPAERVARPRLGFLGVGWIGRNRLEAIVASDLAEIVAIADPVVDLARQANLLAPDAVVLNSVEELLDENLDGIVIATPNALHADQAMAALERGRAVFCQKPLGRDAAETERVIAAARTADRLLGVDLSYRLMAGVQKIYGLIQTGELGEIFAADLVFHNAYGPDKSWFYDRTLSGGGCVIDLGIHLVDLALWILGFPKVIGVSSRLFGKGKSLRDRNAVEDYAIARLDLATGASVQLTCSWKLPAGADAIIEGRVYGRTGGAGFRNLDGSFYDFVAERFRGTTCELLSSLPDAWGGRAATHWVKQLAISRRFNSEIESLVEVARTLDAIYNHAFSR